MMLDMNLNLLECNELNETAVANPVQTAVLYQKVATTHIDDEAIYLVLSGQLWLEHGLELLDFFQPGELVDMLDLWEEYGSGLNVVAHGDCQFVKIDNKLAQMLEIHPPAFVIQIVEKMNVWVESRA